MKYSVTKTCTYKKHTIETLAVYDENGGFSYFWVIDGDRSIGYQSGKDAKEVAGGYKPRWRPVLLNLD